MNATASTDPAIRRKSSQRADDIVEAAAAVLVEGGYSAFTMRRIAAGAGMRLGNLQYYFPAKSDLLQALLKNEFDRRGEELRRYADRPGLIPKARLHIVLDYILRDQENARSCGIFWELWALASHDGDAAKVMDDYYQLYCAEFTALIQELNPALTEPQCERRGALAVSMLEGLSLLRGHGKTRHGNMDGIEKELRESVFALAMR